VNDTERRITELDGIRGLAALGVVVYHYHKHLEGAPLESVLFPIYRGGLLFVDLFFVLSGFILAQVYSHEARYPTLRPAVVSRVARLYPLHLLTLFIVAVLQKLHVILTDHCFIYVYNDWYHLALNVFMLNESGLQTGFSFNGPSWSISTEFIVNILFLAVALRNPKRALLLGLMLAIGMIALDATVHWTEPPRYLLPFNRLFRCFLSFGAGLVLRGIHERVKALRAPKWLVETALIAAIGAMLYFMSMPERPATYYVLTLAVFPALVLLSLRSSIVGAVLRARPIVHLGHISFSIYLLHYPLELLIRDATIATGTQPAYGNPVTLAAVLILCVAASHLTWKYFEMPSRRRVKQLGSG
jgi:peptidoglycan/LPS O-acetylase OafA/YrhL